MEQQISTSTVWCNKHTKVITVTIGNIDIGPKM